MHQDTCWMVTPNLQGNWHKTICCGQFDRSCQGFHYCSSKVRSQTLKQLTCPVADHRCPSPSASILAVPRTGEYSTHSFAWHHHEMRSDAFCKYRIVADFDSTEELLVEVDSSEVQAHLIVLAQEGSFTDHKSAVAGFRENDVNLKRV